MVVGFVDTNPLLFPEAALLFSLLGALGGFGTKSHHRLDSPVGNAMKHNP